MKKKYEKPMIIIENFSLSNTIAGDCALKTETPNSGTCALIITDEFLGPLSVFTSTMSACTTKEADGEYNGICYHVPLENGNMFNS